MRTLSEILPDVNPPKAESPKFVMPERMTDLRWSPPDLSSIDVTRTLSDVAGSVNVRRQKRRPFWPFAIGGFVVASLAGWAILSNEAIRARLRDLVGEVRRRTQAALSDWNEGREVDPAEPVAFTAADTKPIESGPFTEREDADAAAYPAGLGSGDGDDTAP
jgi:hypothetical protein